MNPGGPKTSLLEESMPLQYEGLVGPISRIVWGPRGPRKQFSCLLLLLILYIISYNIITETSKNDLRNKVLFPDMDRQADGLSDEGQTCNPCNPAHPNHSEILHISYFATLLSSLSCFYTKFANVNNMSLYCTPRTVRQKLYVTIPK